MKINKFLMATTAVVAASAMALTGCSSSSGSKTSPDGSKSSGGQQSATSAAGKPSHTKVAASDYAPTPYDQVKDGGKLVTAIYEIPAQENAFHADMTVPTLAMWGWYNPQMGLFDGKGDWKPNPDYLTKVTSKVVNGNTVVTYDIRKEATWNDGTPIDWTAYEATWKINNGKNPAFHVNSTDGYDRITSVTKGANAKEAVVTFKGPYAWWKSLFNIIAHPALKDIKNFNSYVKKVHPEWGAGPYIPQKIDFNKGEAIFVRNPKWWGPKGKLDQRIYRQMKSQASLNAFKNGEIDATGVGSKDRYAAVKDMKGIDIRTGETPAASLFILNAKAPALKDIHVRKAIMQAINRTTLSKINFQGLPYKETPPGSLNIYPFQKGYEDNFSKALPDTGTKAAEETLEKAGYTKDANKVFAKNGKELSVRYSLIGEAPVQKATARAVQKMLKDAGIDCTIDQHPSSEFSSVTSHRNFDILPLQFAASDPFGVAYFGQVYSTTSDFNLTSTGSMELDAKIKKLQDITDPDKQIAASNPLEVEAFKNFGFMPWANGPDMEALKKGIVNYGPAGFAVVPKEIIGWAKNAA